MKQPTHQVRRTESAAVLRSFGSEGNAKVYAARLTARFKRSYTVEEIPSKE